MGGKTATEEAAMEEDTGVGMEVAELMEAEAAMEDIMIGVAMGTVTDEVLPVVTEVPRCTFEDFPIVLLRGRLLIGSLKLPILLRLSSTWAETEGLTVLPTQSLRPLVTPSEWWQSCTGRTWALATLNASTTSLTIRSWGLDLFNLKLKY